MTCQPGGNAEPNNTNIKLDNFFYTTDCKNRFDVKGLTGAIADAASGDDHKLEIVYENSPHFAKLSGNKAKNEEFTFTLGVNDFVPPLPDCVTLNDIQYVAIHDNGNNGWFIASFDVTASPSTTLLTSDPYLYRWIDGNERDYYFKTFGSYSYAYKVSLSVKSG